MGKSVHDDVLDAMLDNIADNCTRVVVCSTEPTTYAEANATYALADVTVTAGDGNGDFTIANGDTSGRKLTLAQQTAVAIDSTGSAQHVALLDVSNSKLLLVTTCTAQTLTSGGTVTIPAFDMEVADPS